jgi:hypothetical protein
MSRFGWRFEDTFAVSTTTAPLGKACRQVDETDKARISGTISISLDPGFGPRPSAMMLMRSIEREEEVYPDRILEASWRHLSSIPERIWLHSLWPREVPATKVSRTTLK